MNHEGVSEDFVKEIYKKIIPPDFVPKIYLDLNPDVFDAKEDAMNHYLTYGVIENRIYKYEQIPNGFDLCHYFNWINKKNSNIVSILWEIDLSFNTGISFGISLIM